MVPVPDVVNPLADVESQLDLIKQSFDIKYKYRPIRNLIISLGEVLPVALSLGLLDDDPWFEVCHKIDQIDYYLASIGLKVQSYHNMFSNPSYPGLSKCPTASALMQHPKSDLKSQYLGVCCLLISQIGQIGQKGHNWQILNRLADDVRVGVGRYHLEDLFRALPDPASGASYFLDLDQAIKRLKTEYSGDDEANAVIRAIEKLSSTVSLVKKKESGYTSIKLKLDSGDGPVLPGEIVQNVVSDYDALDDRLSESPEIELIYQEEFDLIRSELPELAFEELARQAGYWIDRTNQMSSISRSRLNPIELGKLQDGLKEALASEPFVESIPVISIALSLVTGLSVEAVACARIGDQRDMKQPVFSLDGCYIRQVWQALDTKKSKRGSSLQDRNTLKRVGLELPSSIKEWLLKHHLQLRSCRTLAEAAGLGEDFLVRQAKNLIHQLRESGRYQITLPRIESAFPTEITVRFRNPVITTLLAGSVNQPPPSLMYYLAVSEDELLRFYSEAVRHLMGDD